MRDSEFRTGRGGRSRAGARVSSWRALVGISLALLVGIPFGAGCVVEKDDGGPPIPPPPPPPPPDTFDPRGTDVTLHADWQVNGMGADATLCTSAGIANVRIQIAASDDPTGSKAFDLVTVGCAAGKYDSPMAVLASGRYYSSLVALAASGSEVGRSPWALLDVSTSRDATLQTVNFEVEPPPPPMFDPRGADVTLHGEWQINGVNADSVLCMQAGISQVRIEIAAEDDAMGTRAFNLAMVGCGEGKYDSPGPVLAAGRYYSSLVALDAAGMPLAASPFAVLDVRTVSDARLATVNFEVEMPTVTGLLLNLRWDTTPGPTMTDADCATAGVALMSYRLETAGASPMIVSMAERVSCAAALQIPDLVAGEFSLYFEGETSGGAKSWMGNCGPLMVSSGEIAEYDCFADFVGP